MTAKRIAAMLIVAVVIAACASAPPAPTPAEIRKQERNERIVKAACAEWWDGLRELSDEQAEVCTTTGWGK